FRTGSGNCCTHAATSADQYDARIGIGFDLAALGRVGARQLSAQVVRLAVGEGESVKIDLDDSGLLAIGGLSEGHHAADSAASGNGGVIVDTHGIDDHRFKGLADLRGRGFERARSTYDDDA